MTNYPAEKGFHDELARIDQNRLDTKNQLDRERLARVTSDVIRTITSPDFMERVSKAREAASNGAGMDAAAKLLSIDGLRSAGVDIPDDFRMTSRIFEDRLSGVRIHLDDIDMRPGVGPVAWGGCAGAGGLSFCGCGGFST